MTTTGEPSSAANARTALTYSFSAAASSGSGDGGESFFDMDCVEILTDSNFDLIIRHRSNIEKRIIDSDYTIEKLKKENYRYYNDFKNDGVYLIESDYIKTIESII